MVKGKRWCCFATYLTNKYPREEKEMNVEHSTFNIEWKTKRISNDEERTLL
jgi:hypothetical protein